MNLPRPNNLLVQTFASSAMLLDTHDTALCWWFQIAEIHSLSSCCPHHCTRFSLAAQQQARRALDQSNRLVPAHQGDTRLPLSSAMAGRHRHRAADRTLGELYFVGSILLPESPRGVGDTPRCCTRQIRDETTISLRRML